MPVHPRTPCYCSRRNARAAIRLHVEALELRCLPSVTTWPGFLHPAVESTSNDTLDQAQNLGDLSVIPQAEAVGTVGNSSAGAADVDWYRFQLDRAASVTLATPPAAGASQSVPTISLYNDDPNDFNDAYLPLGHRLIVQADSALQTGGAHFVHRLAPGTYYIAISGSGNDYFHPFLANSGEAGATGDYGLQITATDLGLGPADGPIVLAADPLPGATLSHSPFTIRVDLSELLDPGTIAPGNTVQLLSNPRGTFGDGNDQQVALASVNFSPMAKELQLLPAAPLGPGFYQVFVAGNTDLHPHVVANANGVPLGRSVRQLAGADFSYAFRIISNEGNTTAAANMADDTPGGAHQLGDISNVGLLQIPGAIGDDSTDPIPFNPADVDLYHFSITGPGRHAFIAEAFAGRIGSPLDPALSLFQAGLGGQLQFIGANDNTLNDSPATNGTLPLATDSVLYAGLLQGDYYVAVSASDNVPDPALGLVPGTNGIFDPNLPHSGQAGSTTGAYLLNLHVQMDSVLPGVAATTPAEGDVLSGPPTSLLVQFSKPMNLQQVAYTNFQQTTQSALQAVYILGANGSTYYPRLSSYDSTTGVAQFLMLDGLPNGTYQLHLSGFGTFGLTDLAGNPLTGNDASGDYVVHFTVNDPQRATSGGPLQWFDQEPNDSLAHAQDLGVLFPNDLQTGVTVTRDASRNSGNPLSDTADYYRFQVLQSQEYIFSLSGSGLPIGAQPMLADGMGNAVATISQGTGGGVRVSLEPGTYVVSVGGWASSQAPEVSYALRIALGAALENPTPLTIGPAPAYRIALAFNPSTTGPLASSSGTPQTTVVQPAGLSAAPSTQGAAKTLEPNLTSSLSAASSAPLPSPAAPVGLSGSPVAVPHLDISAPAESVSVAAVLLIANYRLGGEVSSCAAIPSEVLASLSALPVGGVRGAIRSDQQPSIGLVVTGRVERQVRLALGNQPWADSLPQAPSAVSTADDPRQSSSDPKRLIEDFAHTLAGLWNRAVDVLFTDRRVEMCPIELFEELLPSAEIGCPQEGATPDSICYEADDLEAVFVTPNSDQPGQSGIELFAYAAPWLGMGAITAVGVNEPRRRDCRF